jgi:UDP-N-acetylglucosamine 2-epimerase (non-hydrolysing)
MKMAPVMSAISGYINVNQILLHTGQHYDANMSDVFFRQLEIPYPDINLEIGSGSHAQQTAQIMLRLEGELLSLRPDLVLVYGDVNSTMAAALVCSKLMIPVGHVEAGLRSWDRSMPEEINRLITDQLSDLLFTPSEDGNQNLLKEGIAQDKIHFVGNVMIDTLVRLLPRADIQYVNEFEIPDKFALVTLHRPSNVDNDIALKKVFEALQEISEYLPAIFPIHPRTRKRLLELKILNTGHKLKLFEPLGYLEFLALQRKATVVITDSGGIQEETSYMGIPCLTLRDNTERPITY